MLKSGMRVVPVRREMKGRTCEVMGKNEVCVPVVTGAFVAAGVGGISIH